MISFLNYFTLNRSMYMNSESVQLQIVKFPVPIFANGFRERIQLEKNNPFYCSLLAGIFYTKKAS